jgi:hypothetical protein
VAWLTPLYHAAGLMRAVVAGRFGSGDAASLGYCVLATALLVIIAMRKLRGRLLA